MTDWLDRDGRVSWHPYTPVPYLGPKAVFTRASGAYVFDDKGRRLFDATSSWWCVTHGHCHPKLVETLRRQAGEMDQVLFSPHTHPTAVRCSEALLAFAGGRFSRVFFSDDGSTAVEAAIKMAVQHFANRGERRNRFLHLERAYHGDTLGAISVSHMEEFHKAFDSIRVPSVASTVPYCYRCPLGLTYPSCRAACVEKAERALDEDGHEFAALILEPLVLGAGGMIVYPSEVVERLVAKAHAKGMLVIFDEVFTGFGRTGSKFAFDLLQGKPDLVCLSKGLTAGMLPLGATLATEGVYDAFCGGPSKTLHHGHTFTANPLSTAVALENVRLFEEEGTMERVDALSARLAAEADRFRDLPHVGDVRHLGGIWAIELVTDLTSRAVPMPSNGPGWRIAARLWEKGFWLRPLGNVLYVVPPYCSSPSDLDALFEALHHEVHRF